MPGVSRKDFCSSLVNLGMGSPFIVVHYNYLVRVKVKHMISDNESFDQFVSEHRWAVLTTLRQSGSPVSSVVAYARDGDELVVSTPSVTFKCKTLERDSRLNLCIVTNEEPFNFVSIEGVVTIEKQDLVRNTRLVFENIQNTGYEEPEDFEGWLESQQRVILRIKPTRVYGVIR
jgi:PPOX class probable F420-dependent enzyme